MKTKKTIYIFAWLFLIIGAFLFLYGLFKLDFLIMFAGFPVFLVSIFCVAFSDQVVEEKERKDVSLKTVFVIEVIVGVIQLVLTLAYYFYKS